MDTKTGIFNGGLILAGQAEISIKKIIKYSLLSVNLYWFPIVYIMLIITSPVLKCIWKNVIEPHEKEVMFRLFLIMCILCFVFPDSFGFYIGMNNGYSYIFSIYLYFTGMAIRKHEDAIKKRINIGKALMGYVATCLLTSGGV